MFNALSNIFRDNNIQIAGGNISLNPTAFTKYKNRQARIDAAKAKEELRTRTSRREESPGESPA